MFDELGTKLDRALSRLRRRAVLNERMIDEGLGEVRRALLEADVNFRVTKQFLAKVRERAVGRAVIKAVRPGEQVAKIVQDELATLLGGGEVALREPRRGPFVVLLVGLQGSGKTTTAAKLARHLLRTGQHRSVLLAGCDLQRPAAIEQLGELAERVGASFVGGEPGGDPVAAAKEARERASDHSALIVDAAGRLQIDDDLMEELRAIREAVQPHETLLVADAMTGQEAVRIAEGFDEWVGITGIVMTKLDGDSRGGAALSVLGVTGKPIKFVGVGEGIGDFERSDPNRLAGRILRMGDVVGLVERAQEVIDRKASADFEKKVRRGGQFTLEDFLDAMRQVRRMGPLDQLLKLLPGSAGKMLPTAGLDNKRLKHIEALILSMTPDERRDPRIIDASRRLRIARGSGRPVAELNRLLKQYRDMNRMMPKMMRMMDAGSLPKPM